MNKDRIEGSEKGIIGKIKEAQGALKLILEPIFEAEVRRSSRAHDAAPSEATETDTIPESRPTPRTP